MAVKASTKALQASDFVPLHNHTHHSVLDGMQKVGEMLDRVQSLGMKAVAITDHGTLSGAIEFYKDAKAREIKPIIGIETYVAARKLTDKDPVKDKARYHLILLAMNNKGYENLMRLSSIANLDGYYYKARIDHELLEKHNEGLICLSGCLGGELGEHFMADQDAKAYEIAKWYKSLFGDRYYLEIQDSGHPKHPTHSRDQLKLNEKLIKMSQELDIPLVLTSDSHYAAPEDKEAQDILLCVQTGAFLTDQDRFTMKDYDLFVEDPKKIIERWGKDQPEAVQNSGRIAERCEIELSLGGILIPQFPVPKGETEKSYLHKLVYQGLAERYGGASREEAEKLSIDQAKKLLGKEVLQRTEYELGVIDSMGFNGYMLIVQDFINWGKDQGIIFGPGRGSAAGSIVSYAIKITEVDPMLHDLMFERFLNPNRISMPDIDVDIQDTRRDEVIQYCVEKYGSERVANIVTFGKMAARAAVRDVARVLQVPYAEADKLAKMIPPPVQGRHIPLKVSIESDPDLKKEYESNATSKRVIDLAARLEGTIRSHGVHAAGVVIAPDDLVKFAPLEMAQKGVVATQYPMGPIEELGLLKMDFLGLSNLTIIKNTLRIIKKVYKNDIDLSEIPFEDEKTFELLQRADTTGVFQVESAGMKRYLKELKPNQLSDIVAMVALYRPGPLAEIPRYIEGKNNPEAVTYLHPSLEPILGSTYGVMVYQEQIILLLQMVAGYTAGEADLVRKAIGKKKREIMEAEEPKFIEGCKKQGLTEAQAKKLWEQIQPFADYSFNKAHATCYATIAYWTAYLKAHYPAAFMAALMTSDQDDTDRLAIEIAECNHMGLHVLAPDVNLSFGEFAVVPDSNEIRFGMNAVKNVGTNAVEEILRAREEGKFTTVEDFLRRVNVRIVNRKNLESLIKAGAFDSFGDRSDLLYNIETMLSYAQKLQKDQANGQVDLFGNLLDSMVPALKLEEAPTKVNDHEKLQWERELLGLYLSAHPLDKYDNYFAEQTMPIGKLAKDMDGRTAVVGGIILTARAIQTKNGSKMSFVKIEDKSGEIEIIVFPKLYEEIGEKLVQDVVVKVKGKLNAKDRDGKTTEELKIIADEITIITPEELDNYRPTGKDMKLPKSATVKAQAASVPVYEYKPMPVVEEQVKPRLYVHVKDPDNHDALLKLKQSFNEYPGDHEVVLVLGDEKKSAMRLPFTIQPNETLQSAIANLLGPDCVALK